MKLEKSIIKLLWVFAVVLLLNALPRGAFTPEGCAELDSNPTITVLSEETERLGRGGDRGNDIDD